MSVSKADLILTMATTWSKHLTLSIFIPSYAEKKIVLSITISLKTASQFADFFKMDF